jgi:hypothetical protein
VLREGTSDYSSNRCLLSTDGHGLHVWRVPCITHRSITTHADSQAAAISGTPIISTSVAPSSVPASTQADTPADLRAKEWPNSDLGN